MLVNRKSVSVVLADLRLIALACLPLLALGCDIGTEYPVSPDLSETSAIRLEEPFYYYQGQPIHLAGC